MAGKTLLAAEGRTTTAVAAIRASCSFNAHCRVALNWTFAARDIVHMWHASLEHWAAAMPQPFLGTGQAYNDREAVYERAIRQEH